MLDEREAIATGLFTEPTDDETSSRTSPDIHTGLSADEAQSALEDLRPTRPQPDAKPLVPQTPRIPGPKPSSVRASGSAAMTAIRVAVLGRGLDGQVQILPLGVGVTPPKDAVLAILVASTPEDSDSLRRLCEGDL